MAQFNIDLENYHNSEWIKIKNLSNQIIIDQLTDRVDRGESEAIALACELNTDFLLIDERLGANITHKDYEIKTIGLVGALIKCKEKGIVVVAEIKPILRNLISKASFWIGDDLYRWFLKEMEESND